MTDREKLVGLLDIIIQPGQKTLGEIAEHLLSNGVTFATDTKDGCQYCKTDKDGYRSMIGGFSIKNPFHGEDWTINAGKYKPHKIYFCPMCGRKLSELPKEGQ